MKSKVESSLYIFPSDLIDDGIDKVASWAERLSTDTLTIALAYHQARDVMPHAGTKPRLRYRRDGVFFFPDETIWEGSRLRPPVQPLDEIAAVTALLDRSSGPLVESWTVFLHNTNLGEKHADVTTRTCFGDRILSNLCPSHPDTVDYARRLADDISSRGIDIVAEALSAQTFGHGHHHERSFTPVSEGDETLLALCFCEYCTASVDDNGGDSEKLAARARARVQAAYAGATGIAATPDVLADAIGEDVFALLHSRESAVTSLVGDVARIAHDNGRRLSFMDLTGALLGYGDGIPIGPSAADQSWCLAIAPAAVAPLVDSYSVLGYARDPHRLFTDITSYRAALGDTPIRVVLRPGHPDTDSAEHLAAKVGACHAAGADQIDYYNYGMYDELVLSWVAEAQASLDSDVAPRLEGLSQTLEE